MIMKIIFLVLLSIISVSGCVNSCNALDISPNSQTSTPSSLSSTSANDSLSSATNAENFQGNVDKSLQNRTNHNNILNNYNSKAIRKEIQILDDIAKLKIQGESKKKFVSLYDTINTKTGSPGILLLNSNGNLETPSRLKRLYNIILNQISKEECLNEANIIKCFLENLISTYGANNLHTYILEKINNRNDAEIVRFTHGNIKSYKLDQNDFFSMLLKFYNSLICKILAPNNFFMDLNFLPNSDAIFDFEQFYKQYPIYTNIYLHEKSWTSIESLDYLFTFNLSDDIK